MKNPTLRLLSTLLAFALAAPLALAKANETPRLQVRVETPTVFNLMLERDIADALAVHLSDAFRRSGFEGRIAQLDAHEDGTPGVPVLTVNLLDWRTRPTGFVECRFTASLEALDGETVNLGAFTGNAVTWNHRDRFTVSRAFEDAAVNAMRDLYRDYAKLDTAYADLASE